MTKKTDSSEISEDYDDISYLYEDDSVDTNVDSILKKSKLDEQDFSKSDKSKNSL